MPNVVTHSHKHIALVKHNVRACWRRWLHGSHCFEQPLIRLLLRRLTRLLQGFRFSGDSRGKRNSGTRRSRSCNNGSCGVLRRKDNYRCARSMRPMADDQRDCTRDQNRGHHRPDESSSAPVTALAYGTQERETLATRLAFVSMHVAIPPTIRPLVATKTTRM